MEGLDYTCGDPPPAKYGYLYDTKIENSLIKSPSSYISTGGISIAPAYGPIRKLSIKNNVMVNTGGISSAGADANVPTGEINPKVGESFRNRQLDISSNWIANHHVDGGPPVDVSTTALTLYGSGAASDGYGTNGVVINGNVLTTYINGSNNVPFQFAGIKQLSGDANKTYRPYNTTNNPTNGPLNFLWRLNTVQNLTDYSISDMQLLNTLDNGWSTSRLVCLDAIPSPIVFSYCSMTGASNSLTFVTNPNATPAQTATPVIGSISIVSGTKLRVTATDPSGSPMRVAVLRNGLPVAVRDQLATTNVSLGSAAVTGDVFEVQVFNHNGLSTTQTYIH